MSASMTDLEFCYDMLPKTSRSFAAVIEALGPELKDAVCIYYLVLRALDTVEDDTSVDQNIRVPLLKDFHNKLYQKGWSFDKCGTGDEKILLMQFYRVINVFLSQKKEYQDAIADITKRMGHGMAEFIQREVITLKDWDLYCHYVAGVVGIGLSRIFAHSGLEDRKFLEVDDLSNSMGLFLQKTNIVRDYLEDINEKRIFWPREVWSKYAPRLADFKEDKWSKEAVACLNDLITNAFSHLPDCITYMSMVKDRQIFKFVAIPQIMAIATLSLCYNNHDVFTSVVKMKREETMKIIASLTQSSSSGMDVLFSWYWHYINELIPKVNPSDPNATKMLQILNSTRSLIQKQWKGAATAPKAKL